MTKKSESKLPLVVFRCVRGVEDVLVRHDVSREAVLLGVSGGGDSMALLEAVSLLAPKLGLDVHVACVDHRTRPGTRAELEAVEQAAARTGAHFHEATIDPGRGDEDTLRRGRHDALTAIARDVASRFVLLGHTRDDQIETILFRFLRGAGLGGLAGMREERPPFLRPLLTLRRSELREMLVARGVAWVEDPTNEEPHQARGRLRSLVIPAVEEAFGRGSLDHLLDVAPRWRADEDFLEAEAARLFAFAERRSGGSPELDLEALREADKALRARCLRRWIEAATGHLASSRELDAVERWIEGGAGGDRGVDVAGGRVVAEGERIRVLASPASKGRDGIDSAPERDDASPATSGDSEGSR